MTIRLNGGTPYEVRLLSAAEALDCLRKAEALEKRLSLPDGARGLSEALAEYGSLCQSCLFFDGARAFTDPEQALAALTLDELCDVYDAYQELREEASFQEESCGQRVHHEFDACTEAR